MVCLDDAQRPGGGFPVLHVYLRRMAIIILIPCLHRVRIRVLGVYYFLQYDWLIYFVRPQGGFVIERVLYLGDVVIPIGH